ncbi:MAG TPA: PilN domain-containing protein [Methylomirabilota bacterium]|nr:PilN domain-containing protein [Methylomirabilota bacterium]
MSEVIGLALHEDRLDGVVVRRRLRQSRVVGHFSLEMGEAAEAALRVKLHELGVRSRRVHVGIPRRRAVVKVIELPAVAGADLRRMVGFELERHLPFPAGDALFDFHLLEAQPDRPVRVLLVAVERRVFERVSQFLREAGLVPRLVDVTIHSLAALAARSSGERREGRVVLQVEDAEAELVVVRQGQPILSRAFPVPPNGKERGHALAEELRRSLATLRAEDREAVTEVIALGTGALAVTDWAELPLHTTIPVPAGVSGMPEDRRLVPALAMALRRPHHGLLRTNLMPDELRPKPFRWPLAVTAGLAAATLLLALAIPAVTLIRDERRLDAIDATLARLAPQVREVEQVAGAVERARREVETLRSFEAQHLRVLPLLRELTELLPQDVWLTNLSADRKGFELAGFANAASQLIPLLEASPALERAEFTSPVTKGRDREQFRLKAGWERLPGTPPPADGTGSPPARQPALPSPPRPSKPVTP